MNSPLAGNGVQRTAPVATKGRDILTPPITDGDANVGALAKWGGVQALCASGLKGLLCEVPGRLGAWYGRGGLLRMAAVL